MEEIRNDEEQLMITNAAGVVKAYGVPPEKSGSVKYTKEKAIQKLKRKPCHLPSKRVSNSPIRVRRVPATAKPYPFIIAGRWEKSRAECRRSMEDGNKRTGT